MALKMGVALPGYGEHDLEERMAAVKERLEASTGKVGRANHKASTIVEGLRLYEQGNMLLACQHDNDWDIPEHLASDYKSETHYMYSKLEERFGITTSDYHKATTFYRHAFVYPRIVLFPHLKLLIE